MDGEYRAGRRSEGFDFCCPKQVDFSSNESCWRTIRLREALRILNFPKPKYLRNAIISPNISPNLLDSIKISLIFLL